MPNARLALALALAASLAPAAALAQPAVVPNPSPAATQEARERFQRGVDLFEERNYDAAMTEFQRAYELTRNPLVLYNISATHELTGHFVEALDAMLEYERRAPPATVQQRRADIDAALGRLRQRIGTVVVRFEASGLDVRVDGLQRSASEAHTGLRLAAGRHRVRLAAPHYQPREEEFDIAGGSTVVISEPLTPEAAFMAVECNVPGAEVLVDGRPIATTPVTSPLPVPEGTHHVVVRRAGYTAYETDVNSVGAGARVRAELSWANPIPQGVGARLTVQANEPNIVALLDGRRVSPAGDEAVPPGPHRLRVEHNDFLPDEREVDLAPGRDTTVSVFLLPTPAHREAYMSTVRRARITAGVTLGLGVAVAAGGLAWYFVNESDVDAQTSEVARLNTLLDTYRGGMCPTGQPQCFMETEQARNNAQVDLDNATTLRWVSLGVTAVGGITAVVGVILFATSPSGSRFDRRASSTPTLLAGPRSLGLSWTF
ncbi:MAG: PEGA domain-containing protein [Polyangiales bacterium]